MCSGLAASSVLEAGGEVSVSPGTGPTGGQIWSNISAGHVAILAGLWVPTSERRCQPIRRC
jgi:hypothetical protein